MERTIYIIDAHGILHKSYHALADSNLVTSKGEEVGALYGFTRIILKILREKRPEYAAVCFDSKGRTFREEIYPEYKANRKETEKPLITQLGVARELVTAVGLKAVFLEGYEADDIIAAIAARTSNAGIETVIVSSDKDICQLVGDRVKLWDGSSADFIDHDAVAQKYGIGPELMVDYFSLVGDSSDNVPGIEGIGPKSALKLLKEYGNLDNILKAAAGAGSSHSSLHMGQQSGCSGALSGNDKLMEKIRKNPEIALLSRQLIYLKTDAPVEFEIQELKVNPPDKNLIIEAAKRLEFRELINMASESVSAGVQETETVPLGLILERAGKNISMSLAFIDGFLCAADPDNEAVQEANGLSESDKKKISAIISNPDISKTCWNLKNILHLAGFAGTGVMAAFDAEIAYYLINPELRKYELSKIMLEKSGFIPYSVEPAANAVSQVRQLSRLAEDLKKEISEKGLGELFESIEMPLVEVIYEMEKNGIKIDKERLKKLSFKFEDMINRLESEIEDMAGVRINLNSPKQMAHLLYEKLKIPVDEETKRTFARTKSGVSTGESVLRSLEACHPVISKILQYREITKLKSSFVDNLLEMAGPDSRLRSNFEQTGTATGRFSSSKPNLQNIPVRTEYGRDIRSCFTAEDGWLLLSSDYSQIDLRVLAHASSDEKLIDSFMKGEDIHLKTAAEVFGTGGTQVAPEMRRLAKAINFGIVYGQTPQGLAEELGISRTEAKKYIDHYFSVYSGVKNWIEENLEFARKNGYVATIAGRRRCLRDINSPNMRLRSFAERIAVNAPIQGGSADIIKKAMVNIYKSMKAMRDRCRMALQVHDELVFEIRGDALKEAADVVKNEMESAFKLKIPLRVDIKSGRNWNEMTAVHTSNQ